MGTPMVVDHTCHMGIFPFKNYSATGEYAGTMTEGPEFETMYSFGGVTGVENIDTIIAADRLADEMGFDTISRMVQGLLLKKLEGIPRNTPCMSKGWNCQRMMYGVPKPMD